MISIPPIPLRRWLAGLGVAAALLAGSCSREADVAPADPLNALSPVTRAAVLRQGLGNVFGTPDLAGLTPYGDRAFTAPLPYPELQERSWELLLIATVDPEDYLHTAVILRPTERGDHYRQYGFSPDGYLQYQVEIRKGEPVRWLVPQREDHYEAIFGRSDMTRASNTDDELWDCGPLDECVIQYPYNHIKNEDGGYNPDDTWWGDDPPPRPDSGGGSGGSGNGSPNDDSKPDGNDPKDPCENMKNLKKSPELNTLLKNYIEKAKREGFESSYAKTTGGRVTTVEHLPGKTYFSLEQGNTYSVLLHNHDGANSNAVFSHNDIITLYRFLQKGHIDTNGLTKFHYLVAGGNGSCGALYIDDVGKFTTFAQSYINDPGQLGMDLFVHLNASFSNEQQANLFAEFLSNKNTGLTFMYTVDIENISWTIKGVNSAGQAVSIECN